MKKILLFVLLLAVGISASARKSYITLNAPSYSGYYSSRLTGDVPEDISVFKYNSDDHFWYNTVRMNAGEILNLLSEYGYEVELMSTGLDSSGENARVQYLLSKEIPSNQTEIEGDVNKDSEVNIADVNKLVDIILGLAKSNPIIMKQLKEQLQ